MLLAQHNEIIGVDISEERVYALNERQSPIIDTELSEYLAKKDLNLSASTDVEASVRSANYVVGLIEKPDPDAARSRHLCLRVGASTVDSRRVSLPPRSTSTSTAVEGLRWATCGADNGVLWVGG